jgi:hypothetical protein
MVPGPFVALALVVVALNVVVAAAVATYGGQKGFPFAPVLIAAICCPSASRIAWGLEQKVPPWRDFRSAPGRI